MMFLPILLALCSLTSASMVRLEDFTKGVSAFASDFYQQCIESDPGNMVISPYSVANALVLLLEAAKGTSFDELKNALHLFGDQSLGHFNADLYDVYHSLLSKSAGKSTLTVANQIYLKQGNLLRKEFLDIATERFSSGFDVVDFAKPSEAAAKMNRFVEQKTNNKIKELVSPELLNSDSCVVLINAVYMKAKWEKRFKTDETFEEDFYSTETAKQPVEFMHNSNYFNYTVLPELDATMLELEYADSEFSFLVILPNQRMGLAALESKLKDIDLKTISEKLNREYVKVSMPKFKIEHQVNLKSILKKMGVSDIFDRSRADLNGLLEWRREPAWVSDAVHKALIEVDEEGTVAAAGTGLYLESLLMPNVPPNAKTFNANHPFVYLIWDKKTKTPIFSGRLTNLKKN